MRHVFACSRRRRYEKLARFPARFVPLGDALASFNPIYGQGMTAAACQALALRDALARGLDGVHRRFLKAAARLIDAPWRLAVGAALALAVVPGPRPLPVRLVNAYVARLRRAACGDAALAAAFLKVVHLVEPPRTLFSPRMAGRVLTKAGPAATALRPART